MQDKASEPTKHCCLPSLFRITLLLRPERLQFCILVCLVSIAFRVFFKLCNALPLDLSPLFLCSPKGLKACVHGLYVYVCVCICKCLCAFEVVCRPLSLSLSRPLDLSLSTSRPLSLSLSLSIGFAHKGFNHAEPAKQRPVWVCEDCAHARLSAVVPRAVSSSCRYH